MDFQRARALKLAVGGYVGGVAERRHDYDSIVVGYRPPERFFRDAQWADMDDWQAALEPHYDIAPAYVNGGH